MHQKWKLYEIGLCRIKIQPSFDVAVYFNSHLHQRHLKIYIYILYHMPFGVELVRHIIIPGALSRWVIKGKINHVGPVVLVCMCAFAFRLPSYFVNGQFIWMVNSPKVLILCTYLSDFRLNRTKLSFVARCTYTDLEFYNNFLW